MSQALELIGLFSIFLLLYIVTKFVWNILYSARIGKVLGKTLDLNSLGSWAVITGATDGIGKAYAEELAQRGINIVLISRSMDRLQSVSSELEKAYDVKTKIIDVDFTEEQGIYERIAKEIQDFDIGILINNVGMSYEYPEYLTQVPEAQKLFTELINCNIQSVVKMTMLVLPQMIEKRKGLILNISSVAAVLPSPLFSMYSGTKTFIHKFSKDLAIECKPFGVNVQCVLPGVVVTKMSRLKQSGIMYPMPDKFVREQLNSTGLETASSGYWAHAVQLAYYRLLLFFFEDYTEYTIFTMLSKTRSKALEKRAQLADMKLKS